MARSKMVLVGVDGSALSHRALRWAFELCADRGDKLLAVSTWEPSLFVDGAPRTPRETGGDSAAIQRTRSALAKAVDDLAGDFPQVTVRQRVLVGSPALELVKLSEHADLLVVGARGHGALAGILLGSVSQYVLAHSTCSVTVVR